MAYNKTNWVENETPINAANLNKIEEGIAANDKALENKQDKLIAGENITIEENGTIKASGSNVINSKDIADKITNTYSAEIIDGLVKDVYSTTEQVIGTWIDGKPLYRKVIKGTVPTQWTKLPIDLNYDTLVFERLSFVSSYGYTVTNGFYENGAKFSYAIGANTIYFSTVDTSLEGREFTLIAEYTK